MAKAKKQEKQVANKGWRYPDEVLRPVREYLASRLGGLEKRKKEIAETDPYNDPSRLNDNAAIDADASEQIEHMNVSALKMSVDRSMIQIRKAMTMLKLGKYGICERCTKMIDTDRLMVMPETTICLDCEKKKEK